MAEILEPGRRDISPQDTAFAVTNITERFTFDANTVALAETNDCLATLIRQLIKRGLIHGTVA